MTRFDVEYSSDSITYFPSYDGGKYGIIFFSILGVMFISTALWTLFDNSTNETRLEAIIALPIVIVLLCSLCRFLFITMHNKIVISNISIVQSNRYTAKETIIHWEDVSGVYFREEHWHGTRRLCDIHLKAPAAHAHNAHKRKNSSVFTLPVCFGDERKIIQFIPKGIWLNTPWKTQGITGQGDGLREP